MIILTFTFAAIALVLAGACYRQRQDLFELREMYEWTRNQRDDYMHWLDSEQKKLHACRDLFQKALEHHCLAALVKQSHEANKAAGWWTDIATGESLVNAPRIVEQKLALIHSEISEALEGHRKNLMDDKLPHRKMIEVELADCLIRLTDLAGAMNLDLAGAVVEKMAFNARRDDHKLANRTAENGKAY